MTPSLTDLDVSRFWSRVDRRGPDDCWLWLAGRTLGGYGSFRVGSRKTTATLFAVLIARGEWPEPGQVVMHRCDNPPCCNPRHLLIGTRRANAVDMISKGRCKASVLTEAEAIEVRRLLADGVRAVDIARRYGVIRSTISHIKRGKTWRHLLPASEAA